MKTEYLILLMVLFFFSCQVKKPNNNVKSNETTEYKTAQIIVEDSMFIIPEYINTNINCIKRAPISNPEELSTQIITSYFSEYSSIYFITVITPKQIFFETYNDTGTPKPSLIFYVENINQTAYNNILKYFNEDNTYKELNYTHDSGQNIMISDKIKNDFGKMWEGDQFPLTQLEASWLVKRHLEIYSELGTLDMEFNDRLLKPVFYNSCNYEKEFNHWKELYPEIQDHELKY